MRIDTDIYLTSMMISIKYILISFCVRAVNKNFVEINKKLELTKTKT